MKGGRRVAVLGLDGVPYTLLKKLFASGIMPRFAQMAAEGAFLPMETSIPAVSSTAWASFMTGASAGEHGIFGFTDLEANEIALRLPSFDDMRAPTIWHSVPKARTVVVNLPFTYPARPLNGIIVSGFVAPLLERAVYPRLLLGRLRSRKYRTDVDAVKGRTDRRRFIADLFETLKIHGDLMLELMDSEPWDLFIGAVTGTDRLHHFFFDAAGDPAHPFHEDFMEYYQRLDNFIGRFLDKTGAGTRVLLLSDHGFTRLKTQVYLNRVLERLGYVAFNGGMRQSLRDIDPRSTAFAMEPNRIYLNCRDRFRTGALRPAEKLEVRARLKRRLESVRLEDVGIVPHGNGDLPEDSLFDKVLVKEELYQGPCMPYAPDLAAIPRRGYDLKAAINVGATSMRDIFTGTHTHDDAFLFLNDRNAVQRTRPPRITDVAGFIREVLV